ncbi:MAG: PDZ domain-containing protein [Acidimicrobiia bacterium]|nr:PDZ domain-containing protein [Acidimicrobiia bacterium]
MDLDGAHRPRVSRETRLLLTTALVAVTTLWALARVRFPDRPPPPDPVTPILSQLASRPALDELAGELAGVRSRLDEVERLLVPPATATPRGYLGIEVQQLTPMLARATRSATGVVVTWVDPSGPAAATVAAGDVVEAADVEPLPTPLHWEAALARVGPGHPVTLRVRRDGNLHDVTLLAASGRVQPQGAALGLGLAARPRVGSFVTRVTAGSAAAQAQISPGDVVTRIAGVEAPSPAAIRRVFADAPAGEPLVVVVARGDTHRVTALEK